jgi:hypothetical protein
VEYDNGDPVTNTTIIAQQRPRPTEHDYIVSGRETGIVSSWYVVQFSGIKTYSSIFICRHRAAHASQGYPGGHVNKIRVIPPAIGNRNRHLVAYVVFEGLAPGIYDTW